MPTRRPRSAAEEIAAALKAARDGRSPPVPERRHVSLSFEEVEMGFDAIAYALGGENAVEYGIGPFTTADWKDGPILLLVTAARIAEEIRPVRMPSLPAIAFGDDPIPALRSLARCVNLDGAVFPRYRLVSASEGSDMVFTALVPEDVDLAQAERNYEAYVGKRERVRARRAKRAAGRREPT